jgi:hypothetical protein
MASVASEICPVRGVWLSCGRHAVQFKMLPQTTRRRQLQARVHLADRASVDVLASWIGSLSSCARRDPPSWLLSRAAPILLKGPSPLRERASPTAAGGCEESAAAQARDVHGLAALDDCAPDEMHGFIAISDVRERNCRTTNPTRATEHRGRVSMAHDGDAGTTGHCASVAPGGLPRGDGGHDLAAEGRHATRR